ncbi:MAG: FAD-dependent oxidoreductase [Pseudomonadota bacterium]
MTLTKTSDTLFDLVIIGGGIFGLWAAKAAYDRGLKVALAERDHIGAGASGGLLGALMPHIPTGWNDKKQFQFDALAALPGLIERLEADTDLSCGYKRTGRAMPLRSERFVDITLQREKAAERNWHHATETFTFSRISDSDLSEWLQPEKAPFGYVYDSLAARIDPRDYMTVLKTWLSTRVSIFEGLNFERFDNGLARFNKGAVTLKSGNALLAHGYEAFDHLRRAHGLDLGRGVKGQAAAFFVGDAVHDMPVIYDDGVYIVPHDNGYCAVGSTSEDNWTDPHLPDPDNHGFIAKAQELCPRLENLSPTMYWAGVRPKCHEREPIVGRLFSNEPLYVATGGFKISFGIAHRIAEALADEITGSTGGISLPESFTTDHHIRACRAKMVPSAGHLH